jgi:hypothetical protein
MSNKYYYLVASLPYLKFGDKPPISKAKFLSECEKWLSEEDISVVISAHLWHRGIENAGIPVLREWDNFNEEKKRQIAHVRTARKSGTQAKIPDPLKEAMEEETPLLIEKALEKIRWDFLEEKSTKHMFDTNWLVLYFLRLQILERLATFDKDEGEIFFYKLCEVSYEKAVG